MRNFIHVFLLISTIIFSTNAQSAFLDTTFGNNGFVTKSSFAYIQSKMLVQPDQKILVRSVHTTSVNGQSRKILLSRFLKDGTPDLGFGDNGFVLVDTSQFFSGGLDPLILLANGKIVTSFQTSSNNSALLVVLKFDNNGQPDPSFGTNGRVEIVETLPANGSGHSPTA